MEVSTTDATRLPGAAGERLSTEYPLSGSVTKYIYGYLWIWGYINEYVKPF